MPPSMKFVVFVGFLALISQVDANAAVEKRKFAQTAGKRIDAVFNCFKNFRIRFERRRGSALIGDADFFERP